MKALSIRQPWAWAIVAGHKKFENRSWKTSYRGPLIIHAGKQFRFSELHDMAGYAMADGFDLPEHEEDYPKGGIIGVVDLVDIVTRAFSNLTESQGIPKPGEQ